MSRGSSQELKGRCLCGHLRFQCDGEPSWVVYCHCESCRRQTASPMTAFFNFPLARVHFEGERHRYESSPGVTRSFCGRCGTPVAYETQKRPGEIDLYLCLLEDLSALAPQSHVFWSEHVPWLEQADDLPKKG